MAMQNDVKAAALSTTGTLYGGRARIRGIFVIPGASAGLLVIKDGGSSGTTLFTIATVAGGQPFNVIIPDQGVLASTSVYAAISNVTGSVFYA